MGELRVEAFVVRIWQEPREKPSRPRLWRGMIEDVQLGETRYFHDPSHLVATLLEWIVRDTHPNAPRDGAAPKEQDSA